MKNAILKARRSGFQFQLSHELVPDFGKGQLNSVTLNKLTGKMKECETRHSFQFK